MLNTFKSEICKGAFLLTEDECFKIVKRRLKTSDIEILQVETSPLGDTPAGFLGDHFRVKITVAPNKSSENPQNPLELRYFVKTLPTNSAHSDFIKQSGALVKENGFHSILVPELTASQTRNGSPPLDDNVPGNPCIIVETPQWTCESYLTSPRMLILDDLSAYGYRTVDKTLSMDFDHCVLTLEALARFHAASIIYEEKEGARVGKLVKLNEVYPEIFEETLWSNAAGHPGKEVSQSFTKCTLQLMKYFTDLEEGTERYDCVYRGIQNLFDEFCDFVKPSEQSRNVITHGDLWANNILYRYANDGTTPLAVRFVDFQLLRYTVPAHDVVCFLYLNTDRLFRARYHLDLALVYHVALKLELARHRLDVEAILPWSQFKDSLVAYHGLGVLTVNCYFPTTLMPGERMAEIFAAPERFHKFMFEDRSDEVCKCFEEDTRYRERITEAMEELVEYFTRDL